MGFVIRLVIWDLRDAIWYLPEALDANTFYQYWLLWRGCRFIYCIALSVLSVMAAIAGAKWTRKLFMWAVLDYHFTGMWFAAFILLLTAGTNTKAQDQATGGDPGLCGNCSWFIASWALTVLSGAAWLASFIVQVHYYRKTKKSR